MKNTNMNKNIWMSAVLLSGLVSAQSTLFQVGPATTFSVEENALVYNGGGVQTVGAGKYDIKGNVMVVGTGSDGFKTLSDAGGAKDTGGNFILRINNADNTSYGQLYIAGLTQNNVTGIVDKEFRTGSHGSGNYYQQVALPFYNKSFDSLGSELNKTIDPKRYSVNEILVYDNRNVVSLNLSSTFTTDPTAYYMVGSKNYDYASKISTLKGVPFTEEKVSDATLKDAGKDIKFGPNGTALNQYRERYNSYLQDAFDFGTEAWANTNYGKNIYQFGNPFFTNLDLSKIGYAESTDGDGNQLAAIQGIRYDPGTVATSATGSTYSTGAKTQTFVTATDSTKGTPIGDVGLIIKPMQTFVIKLTEAANDETNSSINNTLNFKTLRRFNSEVRGAGVKYDVTAKRSSGTGATVKQLGIKGLDAAGNEIARAYYVVYPEATTGHTTKATTQATNSSSNLIGTFEEDAVNGGYDSNYTGKYWLYINEANEHDFVGKAIPFRIYGSEVKSLKFDILENTVPLEADKHRLSTGIGFYYQATTGGRVEIRQGQTIPVTGNSYSLFYGNEGVLSSADTLKPSRTMVVYNPAVDDYVVRFDPSWKQANINVYDMSGRLVQAIAKVKTSADYPLVLPKEKATYLVTAVSEQGEVMNTKILR